MTECGAQNGASNACRVLAHRCGGPTGHPPPHGCRCGMTWGYPLGTTLDRLAFLGLWLRRSGVSESNIRAQWEEMRDGERAEVYAWAELEMEHLTREAA